MGAFIAFHSIPITLFVVGAILTWRLDGEIRRRKDLETVVAKLRDKETLNEQEVVVYMTAKKYDFFGRLITD